MKYLSQDKLFRLRVLIAPFCPSQLLFLPRVTTVKTLITLDRDFVLFSINVNGIVHYVLCCIWLLLVSIFFGEIQPCC